MGTDVPETGVLPDKNGEPLTIGEYRLFVDEMMNQPAWRAVADKEMDYADGRQLDNELLQKQRELALPPAVENLITPTLLSVQGYEATIRTDWRVTADGETGGRDVADALNFKLNRAERQSRADKACSDAFRGQIACGIGWVEVTRNPNPFEFPYECGVIHRNAIHWDMKSYKYDLSDARWLIRRRWLLPERLAQFFPEYAGHFKAMGRGGSDWRISGEMLDGGGNTGLADAWGISGRNTVSEEFWFNETTRELAVAEVWYRRWVTADCLRDKKTGRTVEFDGANPNHREMAANGAVLFAASVPRMRRAFVVGDLVVRDEPTPYPHQKFPYVPFFGFREDNTGIPYGYVRNMKYAQDNLNSTNSKLRWGLSAIRTVRTKGIVDMSDEQFRRNIARVDADIVLNKIKGRPAGRAFRRQPRFRIVGTALADASRQPRDNTADQRDYPVIYGQPGQRHQRQAGKHPSRAVQPVAGAGYGQLPPEPLIGRRVAACDDYRGFGLGRANRRHRRGRHHARADGRHQQA